MSLLKIDALAKKALAQKLIRLRYLATDYCLDRDPGERLLDWAYLLYVAELLRRRVAAHDRRVAARRARIHIVSRA
jgi:hypothetical protein